MGREYRCLSCYCCEFGFKCFVGDVICLGCLWRFISRRSGFGPAVGWSTSFSIVQAGQTPVLVDVDPDTLCIEGERDRPILALHLLGCPSSATAPLIIEDACGAHGAMLGSNRVGSLGVAGAFSFFFSHHISTIEGGMITTDRQDIKDAARSIRAHGWIRERSDRQQWIADHPTIDPRFMFALPGYNLRMTEISGAFGIHQVPRLDGYVAQRRQNHANWCERIQQLGLPLRVFPEPEGVSHAAFAFPMLLDEDSPMSRTELCHFLNRNGFLPDRFQDLIWVNNPLFQRFQTR